MNVPPHTFLAHASSSSAATPELVMMRGKRFVTAFETEPSAYLYESRLKSIVGGDKITARNLYSSYVELRLTGKFWFATKP